MRRSMFFLLAELACFSIVFRFSSFLPSLGADWARRRVIGFSLNLPLGLDVFSL
jgi:hypothetical protein